jgi:hypothetical protein
MLGEELLNILGLVRREVVEHHMNFLGPSGTLDQALEKRYELLGSVPGRRHTVHRAGLDVNSGVQRERAVAIV